MHAVTSEIASQPALSRKAEDMVQAVAGLDPDRPRHLTRSVMLL